MAEIEILEPGAESLGTSMKLAARIGDLNGKVIGFLDNGKTNADALVDMVQELITSRYKLAGVVRKGRASMLGRHSEHGYGGEDATILELVEKCDAVVNGVGD